MIIVKQLAGLVFAISLIAITGASPVNSEMIPAPKGFTKITQFPGDPCYVKLQNPQCFINPRLCKSSESQQVFDVEQFEGKVGRHENVSSQVVTGLYHVSSEASIQSIWQNGVNWDILAIHSRDFDGKGEAGFYLGDDYEATVKFLSGTGKPIQAAVNIFFDASTSGIKIYRFANGKDELWRAAVNYFKWGEPYPAKFEAKFKPILAAEIIIGPIDDPNSTLTQYTFKTANSIEALRKVTTYAKRLMKIDRCMIS